MSHQDLNVPTRKCCQSAGRARWISACFDMQPMFRLAVILLPMAGLLGCNTPQIPLPPPVIEDLSFTLVDESQHLGRLAGSGENTPHMAGATVRAINLRDGYGVMAPAAADGSFETRPFELRHDDDVQLDYSLAGELSDPLCLTVHYDGPPSPCEGTP